MASDVEVVEEYRVSYPEHGTLAKVRILRVPESETFPLGIKYSFHYGYTDGDDAPIVRFDNHHGHHEKHEGDDVRHIDFPGLQALHDRFRDYLPE